MGWGNSGGGESSEETAKNKTDIAALKERATAIEGSPKSYCVLGVFDRRSSPVGIRNDGLTTIKTGTDLTNPKISKFSIYFRDAGNLKRYWPSNDLLMDNKNNGREYYVWNFDNDFLTLKITDHAKGWINIKDSGREAEFVRFEALGLV